MININIKPKEATILPPQQKECDLRQININDTVSFAVQNIPIFSSDTVRVFQADKFEVVPLNTRAERMFDAAERLANAEKDSTKHKIFCFLKTALITAVIVVGILGCVALASTGFGAIFGLVLATLIISGTLGIVYGSNIGLELTKAKHAMFFVGLIGGPFFPIYEAMTKIPSLKEEAKNEQEEFRREFCHMVTIFKNEALPLREVLMKNKQEIEQDIIKTKGILHVGSLGLDLENKKNLYEKALEELDQAIKFYAQFDNIQIEEGLTQQIKSN